VKNEERIACTHSCSVKMSMLQGYKLFPSSLRKSSFICSKKRGFLGLGIAPSGVQEHSPWSGGQGV